MASASGVEPKVSLNDAWKGKLDLGESKDKLEACLSLTFSSLGAEGDVWEKLGCITTEGLHTWLGPNDAEGDLRGAAEARGCPCACRRPADCWQSEQAAMGPRALCDLRSLRAWLMLHPHLPDHTCKVCFGQHYLRPMRKFRDNVVLI